MYVAIARALGVTEPGQALEIRGTRAEVERVTDLGVLLRLTGPVPGYLALYAYDKGDGVAVAQVSGYLVSEEAEAFVVREEPAWEEWLETLPTTTRTG